MKKFWPRAIAIVLGALTVYLIAVVPRSCAPRTVNLATTDKIDGLLRLIEKNYVDSVDIDALIEKAMPKVLEELDPHSVYIPAKDLEQTNSELAGSFSGVGIQFMIQSDTIYVSNVIHGGPAEKVGLFPGDRIVTIDDSLFVGKKLTNESAMSHLKGPFGSTVKVGVRRQGHKELIPFTIVRGNIPVKSVEASYLIDGKWGYINVTKFGETTYAETLLSIAQLLQQGMEGIIIDLRDNTGGYMAAAMQMLNEFLPKGQTMVYTEGENARRHDFKADGRGTCKELPLVVLINEISASASEIFAGAIQDNDRGILVGRRTFGKGLVQQPFEFSDGSAVRLTVARYHTPSGRCIQKPYTSGDDEQYLLDILTRYERGEFFSQDSIHQNETEAYTTLTGRTVYGGGGIMPDIFVPQDTTGFNDWYMAVSRSGLFRSYTFNYTDRHRSELADYTTVDALLDHLAPTGLSNGEVFRRFLREVEKRGITARPDQLEEAREHAETIVYGNIIYNLLGMNEYQQFLNRTDPMVLRAIEVFEKEESFPQLISKTDADSVANNSSNPL
jgi:carboxyl-terminal processing protease